MINSLKEVVMKMKTFSWISFLISVCLLMPTLSHAGGVDFKPGRAPSLGPEDARVVIYEIGDFS